MCMATDACERKGRHWKATKPAALTTEPRPVEARKQSNKRVGPLHISCPPITYQKAAESQLQHSKGAYMHGGPRALCSSPRT